MSLSPSLWAQRPLPEGILLPPSRSASNPPSKSLEFPYFHQNPHQEPHAGHRLLPNESRCCNRFMSKQQVVVFCGKRAFSLLKPRIFNTSPPLIKESCQASLCWCTDFCFPGGSLGVCLACHMLFPAENSFAVPKQSGGDVGKKKERK